MRLLLLILISLFLTACGQKNYSEANLDSASVEVIHNSTADDSPQSTEDSSFFVGAVRAWPKTSEYYVSLFYLANVKEENFYEFLETKLDSLIVRNEDGETRRRLPVDVAKKYFQLSGLEQISIYNKRGDLITDAVLKRIEYREDLIEGEFVAVFKPMISSWFKEDVAYCTTAVPDAPAGYLWAASKVRQVEDKTLTERVLTQLKLDSSAVINVKHFNIEPYPVIYTAVNLNDGYLLIETSGEKLSLVLETKNDDSVSEIMPVNIEMNKRPVLLITSGVHETDMVWTSLFVYSSSKYERMEGNRLTVN